VQNSLINLWSLPLQNLLELLPPINFMLSNISTVMLAGLLHDQLILES